MGKKQKKSNQPDEFVVQDGPKMKTVVRVAEFEGKQYLDIRKLYLDDKGDWMATRKGIMLPYDRELLKTLRRGIRQKMPALAA